MENFTPIASTLGGALIGLSAIGLMLFQGRICGISGIFGSMLARPPGDTAWRTSFVVGLIVGGAIIVGILPGAMDNTLEVSLPILVGSGLLVGIGTQVSGGCTSGHGICGLSRFSLRSLVATMTFMGTGAVAAYLVQHVIGGAA